MTKQEEQNLKKLVIEALSSKEVRQVIREETLEAMKSKEGKEIFSENFVNVYREFVEPTLEDMWDDIRQLKTEVRHMKEKNDIRFERLERRIGVAA